MRVASSLPLGPSSIRAGRFSLSELLGSVSTQHKLAMDRDPSNNHSPCEKVWNFEIRRRIWHAQHLQGYRPGAADGEEEDITVKMRSKQESGLWRLGFKGHEWKTKQPQWTIFVSENKKSQSIYIIFIYRCQSGTADSKFKATRYCKQTADFIIERSTNKTNANKYIWVFPKIGVSPKWMVYNGKPY